MSATGRSPVRIDQDVYPTPSYCVEKLLKWVDFSSDTGKPTRFLEPCRGDGAIYNCIPEKIQAGESAYVILKDYYEIREGRDYLVGSPFVRPDIIITNPPYSLAMEFLIKSLAEADTVIYLLRLNFLGSIKRREFWRKHPPTHLFTIVPRPRFVNDRSDSCEYGWFCWDSALRITTDSPFNVL